MIKKHVVVRKVLRLLDLHTRCLRRPTGPLVYPDFATPTTYQEKAQGSFGAEPCPDDRKRLVDLRTIP